MGAGPVAFPPLGQARNAPCSSLAPSGTPRKPSSPCVLMDLQGERHGGRLQKQKQTQTRVHAGPRRTSRLRGSLYFHQRYHQLECRRVLVSAPPSQTSLTPSARQISLRGGRQRNKHFPRHYGAALPTACRPTSRFRAFFCCCAALSTNAISRAANRQRSNAPFHHREPPPYQIIAHRL